jgi:hypothetical protein
VQDIKLLVRFRSPPEILDECNRRLRQLAPGGRTPRLARYSLYPTIPAALSKFSWNGKGVRLV